MNCKKILVLISSICLTGMLFSGVQANASDRGTYVDGTASAMQYQYLSGEVEAIQYQTYNFATEKLKNIVSSYTGSKHLAVVLDLDETVLNNYGSEINDYLSGKGYSSDRWAEWVGQSKATIIPGADEFLKTADKLGVNIYYITNRDVSGKQATVDNLKKLGLPCADDSHVLVKTDSSSKQDRVNKVSDFNDIVMFVGDNLGDFPAGFYKKSNEERKAIVESNKEKFGAEYIILPNATYGDWDTATYGYDYSKTDDQKVQCRIDGLNKYNETESAKIK